MLIFAALSATNRIGPKRLCLALLLLVSTPLLIGCETQPPIVITQVEVIREIPPAIWMVDCETYIGRLPAIETNGDLALVVDPLVSAIEQCTADKRALRAWAEPENVQE